MRTIKLVIIFFFLGCLPTICFAGKEPFNCRIEGSNIAAGNTINCADDKYNDMANGGWQSSFRNKGVKNTIALSIDEENLNFTPNSYQTSVTLNITYYVHNSATNVFDANTISNTSLSIEYQPSGVYRNRDIITIDDAHKIEIEIVSTTGTITNAELTIDMEVERFYAFDPLVSPQGLNNTPIASSCELEVTWTPQDGAEYYDLEWLHINDYDGTGGFLSPANIEIPKRAFDFNSTRISTAINNYVIPLLYESGYVLYRVRGVGKHMDDMTKDVSGTWSENGPFTNVQAFGDYYLVQAHQDQMNWQATTTFIENGKRKTVAGYADGSLRNRQVVSKLNSEDKIIVGETIYDHQGRPTVQILPVPVDTQKIEYQPRFNLNSDQEPYSKLDFDLDGTNCQTPAEPLNTISGASNYYSPANTDNTGHQAYLPDAEGFPLTQIMYTPDNTGRVKAQSGVGPTHQIGSTHETKYLYGKPHQEELDRFFGSEVGLSKHYKKNMVIDANGQISISYMNPQGRVIATGLSGTPPSNVDSLSSVQSSQITVDLLNNNPADGAENVIDYQEGSLTHSRELLVASESYYNFNYTIHDKQYNYECSGDIQYPDSSIVTVNQAICYDCVFDLEISLKDECGAEYLLGFDVDNGAVTDTIIRSDVLEDILNGNYQPCSTNNQNPDSTFTKNWQANDGLIATQLAPNNYSLSKKLKLNQAALDYYTDEFIEHNECLLDSAYFFEQAMMGVDTLGCFITCESCLEALGDPTDYSGPDCAPCFTTAEYEALVEACLAQCDTTSYDCEVALNMMYSDVSPSGQYGLYTSGGQLGPDSTITPQTGIIDPSSYDLSLFNENNYLSSKGQNWDATWRNPYNPNATSTTNYLDEDGQESLIQVVDNGNGYEPPILPNTPVITINGLDYVYPKRLLNVADFLDNWQESWREALVFYHPEYCYYEYCIEFQSSYDFDHTLGEIDSYLKATDFLFDIKNPTLNDPYFTNGFDLPFDPNQDMKPQVNLAIINALLDFGNGASMVTNAERAAGCPDFDPTVCPGNSCGDGLINSDLEWQLFKGMYLSTKQKIMDIHKAKYAIEEQCYNGCFSNEVFNPFDFGFMKSNLLPLNSEYFKQAQPCSKFNKKYYEEKIPRFPTIAFQSNSLNANPNINFCTEPTEEFEVIQCEEMNNQIADELLIQAEFAIYESCGKCPLAFRLEQFLGGMVRKQGTQVLLTTSLNLSCNAVDIPEFFPAFADGFGFSSTDGMEWEFIDLNPDNVLTATIKNSLGESCNFQLYLPGNHLFNDIVELCCIEFTQAPTQFSFSNGFNFFIKARLPDPNNSGSTIEVEIEGVTECLNIGDCQFEPICEPTLNAYEFQNLFNVLLANDNPQTTSNFFNTNGLNISSDPFKPFLFDNLLVELNANSTSTFNWKYNGFPAGKHLFEVTSSNGGSCTIAFDNPSFPIQNIRQFLNVRHDPLGNEKDFKIIAIVEDQNGLRYETLTGTNTCLELRQCQDALPGGPLSPEPMQKIGMTFVTCAAPTPDDYVLGGALLDDLQSAQHQQNWDVPMYHGRDWTRAKLGSVFGLARDEEETGDLFVAASAVYNDDYFPGGFGAIYRIDGKNGRLLKNSLSSGSEWINVANTDSASLGNISYNQEHNLLYATNMKTGEIYTYDDKGDQVGVPFDPFDPHTMHSTEKFAPLGERLFGVKDYNGRLYFSVWNSDYNHYGTSSTTIKNKVYSVELNNGIIIQGTLVEEIEIDYYDPNDPRKFSSPVADITFSPNGKMILGERTMGGPDTSFAHIARVLVYEQAGGSWQKAQTNHFSGEMAEGHNACGGVAWHDDGYILALADGIKFDPSIPEFVYGISVIPEAGNSFQNVNSSNYYTDLDGFKTHYCKGRFGDVLYVNTLPESAPGNSGFCDPLVIEGINVEDDCVKNLLELAGVNARNHYEAYLADIRKGFQEDYIRKCLNVYEEFGVTYQDAEHHFTLYYYDQAGNLVRTVPPEGVEKITDLNTIDQIQQDRSNDVRTIFTDHSYTTTYKYNSLNQLVAQTTPDHEDIELFDLEDRNNGILSGNVWDTEFISRDKGIAFGELNGKTRIFSTSDGGENWSVLDRMIEEINALEFIDFDNAYAVGANGLIAYSSARGINWKQISSPTNSNLVGLHFISNLNGRVYNDTGDIWHTVNAGQSWMKLTTIPLKGGKLSKIHFGTDQKGFAVSTNGLSFYSDDAGETWTQGNTPLPNLPLNGVFRDGSDPLFGYAVGLAGQVIKTIDGGANWILDTNAVSTSAQLNSVYFDGQIGLIVGQNGFSMISSDQGNTWSILITNTQNNIHDVIIHNNQAVAVGENALKLDANLSSGQFTWYSSTIGSQPITFNDIDHNGSNSNIGTLIGGTQGTIYQNNASNGWNQYALYFNKIRDAQMVTAQTGYAVGDDGTVIKTIDFGESWRVLVTPISSIIRSVHFIDVSTGFIVGSLGQCYKTENGGSTWTAITLTGPPDADYFDIDFDGSCGLVVGRSASTGGILLTTGDKGTTWNNISSSLAAVGLNAGLRAVDIVNMEHAVVGGDGGEKAIVKTPNTVPNITNVSHSSNSNIILDIAFRDFKTGFAACVNGVLLKTENEGANWTQIPVGTTASLIDLELVDDYVGYISGNNKQVKYLFDLDNFSTQFYYDRLGRLVVSQNAKQYNKSTTTYSYTLYDERGRITEVGEIAAVDPIEDCYNGKRLDDAIFANWIHTGTTSGTVSLPQRRTEVTRTYYDRVQIGLPITQDHLRNRVVSTSYEEVNDDDDATYDYATHYSYDIHGNVNVLLQDQPKLSVFNQQFKKTEYRYDLISGSVLEVAFQPEEPDQFYHRYEYDADNRLTNVLTSKDKVIWEEDAKYFYYQHGPLARMELGHNKVQGMDYAYTIQGWIKGVNSNTLDQTRDIGKDGQSILNKMIPEDEMGYTLGYFAGDYSAINSPQGITHFEATTANSELDVASPNLYNGNIRQMVTGIRQFMQGTDPSPNAMAYTYDQLHRIKSATAHQDVNAVNNNTWSTSGTELVDYASEYTYDANGNLKTLNRSGFDNPGIHDENMDSLSYIYLNKANGYHKNTNKLAAVKDRGNNSDPTAYNDFKGSHYFSSDTTSLNNYQYDAIGNLIEDKEEGISDIEWTVYGKVKRVEKTNGDIIEFDYDPAGNRIRKATPLGTTHYVRDASGNMMATYKETPTNDSLHWQSAMLYGSSRLGTYEADTLLFPSAVSLAKHHTFLGKKRFELSNHLGNVLVTVSDRKIGVDDGSGQVAYYEAEVLSASDYYPFGFSMPGRSFDQGKYRFGFNGQEQDTEWRGGQAVIFKFRVHDPRIAKFLSVDPLSPEYPWNSPYAFAENRVIQGIDLEGAEYESKFDVQILGYEDAVKVRTSKENEMAVGVLAGFSPAGPLIDAYDLGKAYNKGDKWGMFFGVAAFAPGGDLLKYGRKLWKSSDEIAETSGAAKQFANKSKFCGCFTEETVVHTDSGYVKISEIEVGDFVWAFDQENNEYKLKEVLERIELKWHEVYEIYVKGEVLRVTNEHPVFVANKWKKVQDLLVGDSLQMYDGLKLEIDSINITQGNFQVFNFEVKDLHNYFVGYKKILVHNGNPCDFMSEANFQKFAFDPDTRKISPGSINEVKVGLAAQREGLIPKLTDRGPKNTGTDLVAGNVKVDIKEPRADYLTNNKQLLGLKGSLASDKNLMIIFDPTNVTDKEIMNILERAEKGGIDISRIKWPSRESIKPLKVGDKTY